LVKARLASEDETQADSDPAHDRHRSQVALDPVAPRTDVVDPGQPIDRLDHDLHAFRGAPSRDQLDLDRRGQRVLVEPLEQLGAGADAASEVLECFRLGHHARALHALDRGQDGFELADLAVVEPLGEIRGHVQVFAEFVEQALHVAQQQLERTHQHQRDRNRQDRDRGRDRAAAKTAQRRAREVPQQHAEALHVDELTGRWSSTTRPPSRRTERLP
jgi:hypothetical protein